jgi:hypothetical protein
MVELLALLLRIWDVPAPNLGPGDRLYLLRFSWFSSVPLGKCLESTLKLYLYSFLPNPFQIIIIRLSPYHRRYVV